MRSLSTSRPWAMSTIALSAPEVTSASAGKVGHSACQPPSARSCSCTCAAMMVASRLGAMVAAASAAAAAVGLRLCGMVEEPPRPGAAGSKASATSVCIRSETSRAILPQVPARIANADATSASRSRWLCHGASGSGRSSRAASRSATSRPAIVERGERADGAAELQHQRLPAQPPQPLARARQRRRIARELEPERHRQRVLHPGAPDRGGAAVAPGQRGEAVDGFVEIGDEGVDGGLAARAPARCR